MKKKKYYIKLDLIRVISCIMIFLYHLNIVKGGFLLVCTFFVLSGYLGCISVLENENFSLKTYYLKRLKQIYLPLTIIVFLTLIFSRLNSTFQWTNLKNETISVLFGYNNFWQLATNQDYFTKNVNSPFIHLWYTSILLQFELIFPIICVAFRKNKNRIPNNLSTIIVGVLTLFFTILFYYMSKTQDIMVVYYNTFLRIFSILSGVFLALIHYKYDFKIGDYLKKYESAIFTIYIAILLVLCLLVSSTSSYFAIFMILATLISARLIEYSTISVGKRAKENYNLQILSKISYNVYLVQYPVIFFMQKAPLNGIIKTILVIIITFILSSIIYIVMNYPTKKVMLKMIKITFFSLIIIVGSVIVILEKDHTTEMNELKNRINENLKFLEEKNNEYLNEEVNIEENSNQTTNNKAIQELENTVSKKEDITNKNTDTSEKNMEKDDKSANTSKDDSTKEIEQTKNKNIEEKLKKLPVVGIGDSVLLSASKELYNKFPNGYFDGKVSRTILKAESILKDLKSKGKLSNTIILFLANNGDYSDKRNKELMEIIENRQLYWVDAVGADDPQFNEKFRKFAKDYPNIHIVEWEKEAKAHPELLEPDKIHPNNKGGKELANLIYEKVYNDYSN